MIQAAKDSRLTIGLALSVLVAGCAGALPQRYPSRAPGGMAVTRAEADERACVDVAKRATTERAWALGSTHGRTG